MNKREFIEELSKQTSYDKEQCTLINSIVEETFFIGRKGEDRLVENFKNKLNLDESSARDLAEKVINIIGTEIKNKLKFRRK